jgi:DNA replication protein DnaC
MSCDIVITYPEIKGIHMQEKIQKISNSIKERQKLIALSNPDDIRCRECGRLFSANWDRFEGKWVFPEMTDNGICRQCRKLQHIRQNIETYLKQSGIPLKYLKCAFENFRLIDENRKCYAACRQYLLQPKLDYPGLYLYGKCGTGKTHLSVAIARELLLKGQQVCFTSVPGLCFDIRKAITGDVKFSEQTAIKNYISCDYLVLDDLGVEKPTEWAKKTLNYIIYERDNNFKPTIITANLSLDDIANQIDKRISSRIAGMGQVIRVQGPDWRLKHPVRLMQSEITAV